MKSMFAVSALALMLAGCCSAPKCADKPVGAPTAHCAKCAPAHEVTVTAEDGTEDVLVGGYSEYRALTEEDRAFFDKVMKGSIGENFTPLSVATQVVSGTNYDFACVTKDNFPVHVIIFKPLPCYEDTQEITITIEGTL